jgi:DNA-binding IclR family transcriptional regulator
MGKLCRIKREDAMAHAVEGNKAKTARRVIEVLEFFDEQNRQATVMDIVRRYNRPQSSTSELLASLVEMGLLYKDQRSRSYTLTPRAAILGSLSQPSLIRDGRLSVLIDRLIAHTGLSAGLLGMVGLNAQLFRWSTPGKSAAHRAAKFVPVNLGELGSGAQTRLCDTAAGLLLLSTMKADRRDGVLRRLNAEADADSKFNHAEMVLRVQDSVRQGYAVGPAGFGSSAEMVAMLLPDQPGEAQMALSFIYEPCVDIDPAALVTVLRAAMQRCAGYEGFVPAPEIIPTPAAAVYSAA